MSGIIVPNPAYAGRTPEPLGPACCDGSAPLTVQCACGEQSHYHESQIRDVPDDTVIGSRCLKCRKLLTFDVVDLRSAWRQMREAGLAHVTHVRERVYVLLVLLAFVGAAWLVFLAMPPPSPPALNYSATPISRPGR